MSVEVHCTHCDAIGRVNSRFRGRRVHCPKCNGWVDVPNELDPTETNVEQSHDPSESSSIDDESAEMIGDDDLVELEDDGFDDTDDFLGDAEEPLPIGAESIAAAANGGSTLVTGSTLHRTHEITEGHALGLEFDDDDEPPKRKKRDDGELDMTPMVDVTFLLLIFFMVTASFSLQKSIQMPRQQSDAPSSSPIEEETEELDSVEVQIDEFGAFMVLGPDWERETPGKQNLISALKDAMGGGRDGMRLVIKVQEAAKLQALVDCMDAGTIAGYTELQVTQVEEFD